MVLSETIEFKSSVANIISLSQSMQETIQATHSLQITKFTAYHSKQ